MKLKVLLPFGVFIMKTDVQRIIVETLNGYYGLLPNRLDCAGALPPGILMYETETDGKAYLAVDEGVLIKAGENVTVSVRNAVGGVDLGQLHETLEKEFLGLDEREKSVRTVIARLESGLIRQFEKFQKFG